MQFEVSSLYRHQSLPACFCPEKSQRAEFLGRQGRHFLTRAAVVIRKWSNGAWNFAQRSVRVQALGYKPTAQLFLASRQQPAVFPGGSEWDWGMQRPFVMAPGAIVMPVGTCSLQGPLLPTSGSWPLGFLWMEIGENMFPSEPMIRLTSLELKPIQPSRPWSKVPVLGVIPSTPFSTQDTGCFVLFCFCGGRGIEQKKRKKR